MKRYETYKDSGIEWIGDIPAHWSNVSLKWISKIYSGGTPSKNKPEYWTDGTIPWLNSGTVNQGDITEVSEYITDEALANSSAKWIPEKAILIALAGQGKTKGMVAQTQFEATCNQSLGIIVPNYPELNRFLLYWLRKNYQNIRNLGGGDKRDGINLEMIGSIPVPLPTKEEQKATAKYLDKKTAEIDQLIAEKKKLVALYQEEKTAIINQAVTKGINSNVKLKDSGIEWLGDIPEHWEIKKIKHLLKKQKGAIKTGPFGSQLKNSDLSSSGDYKVYTQRNVLDNDFVRGIDRIDDEKFESLSGFEVFPKDILFTSRGTIGKCSIFPIDAEKGILHPCLIRIQIDEELVFHNWIVNYVNSSSFFIENVKLESNSTIIDVIYGGTLKEIIIPFPPKEEQTQIVQHIEKETARIDVKIVKAEQYINLLTEYRTALISEVVTGKIKVIN